MHWKNIDPEAFSWFPCQLFIKKTLKATQMSGHQKATLAEWPKKIAIKEIHKQFGSPAWIVSEQQLLNNVQIFEKFTGKQSRILFPVKTNPSFTVLQVLAAAGAGADCASRLEVNLALFAGIGMENISYNSPAQDVHLAKSLLISGAMVVMDDISSITMLQQLLEGLVFGGKLFLRINLPDYVGYAQAGDNQELMAHGHSSSKFGIPAEELDNLLKQITIPVSGLHVHVGTQMDNLESFKHAINSLNTLADELRRKGHPIYRINIGGGLGIPFSSGQDFPSPEYWCQEMAELKKSDYQYYIEPGHALCGNAVSLLTRILTIKNSRGKKWVIADTGTDQLAKVTLLKWPHRILDENGNELQPGTDAVAGPLCFAGDTLAGNINAEKLRPGSPLLVTEAGAYTFSLANKFNGRLAPGWLLLKADGSIVQTQAGESLYDELQHSGYEWNVDSRPIVGGGLDLEKAKNLSSIYLRETAMQDNYSFTGVQMETGNRYRFIASASSAVDFISMPFAIRILGDATIISVLDKTGHSKKDVAVWGRKVTMDCFDQIPVNEPMEFIISLSEARISGSKNTIVSRFKTRCGKCSGSFIVSFRS